MSVPVPPGTAEVIRRLRAVDTVSVRSAADAFEAGGELALELSGQIERLIDTVHTTWRSRDGEAMTERLRSCVTRWTSLERALTGMARALRVLEDETERARAELTVFDRQATEAYMDPGSGPDAGGYAERAADVYHDAERRLRVRFWELGDEAAVGEPRVPAAPLAPRTPWWQGALFGSPGFYAWRDGRGGLLGFDEDGALIPAHHGHPEFIEVSQSGLGGLLRRVPRVGRRLKVGPDASLRELTEAFADDIAKAYGWRPAHIDRHIREWYRLANHEPVPKWMKEEFRQKVASAAARSGKVVPGRLVGQPTNVVLHFDQASKRFLMVHFHARGRYVDQFASAFVPTNAQVDAFLRRAASVKGV